MTTHGAEPRRKGWEDRVAALFESVRRLSQESGQKSVEVVRGGASVSSLAYGAAAAARYEMLSLEPIRTLLPDMEIEAGMAVDRGLMERGVIMRMVIAQSVWSRDDRAAIEEMSRVGPAPRFHPDVPLRLLVYDRRLAFVPLDPDNIRTGAYAVRDESLIEALCQLFEDVWACSGPPPLTAPDDAVRGNPADIRVRVIQGLTLGLKDEAIARRLGVSPRTVRRLIAQLLVEYDCGSRFQLAMTLAKEQQL